ncbi:molybdopterin oxidoreductase family protein [Frankia canadensis]|nr:molybdopterin oxidoreductase family protein [Frankia canadensis]
MSRVHTTTPDGIRVGFRTCPLCESSCGLAVSLAGDEVVGIRGDAADVFSRGFLCPKGVSVAALDTDPDRVRTPLLRRGDDVVPVSWDDAFAEVHRRLVPILREHGPNAVALYSGNPTSHNLSGLLYTSVLLRALGTQNYFTATTLDAMPKMVAAGLMFGTQMSIAVPDVDRTDYLLVLGANPAESNGSLMTAPDMPGRLRALRARGGRLVVVDPRRTRTAELADEHVTLRPGTDAYFLFAVVHVLVAEGLVRLGHLDGLVNGVADVGRLATAFPPEAVASRCAVPAGTIRRLARELAAAPSAAVYGRLGTCAQEFGTLTSWLVDVINVLTGNLDRPGGAMFTLPASGSATTQGLPGRGQGVRFGRWHSRVGGHPEIFGELPAGCLAEEIDTPGTGQVRALVTLAGNPALSAPNGPRISRALASLDFMVSVDIYRNETTRHADLILPAPRILTRSHYDLGNYQLAVRNIANYSEPLVERAAGEFDEWEILLRLARIAQSATEPDDPDLSAEGLAAAVTATDDAIASRLAGRTARTIGAASGAELLAAVSPRRGPDRLLDLMLRGGPYRLSLDDLLAQPHGIDLGPLRTRLPDALRTPSGAVELAPAPIAADVDRLREALSSRSGEDTLILIGRRHLRSNNSWMHNIGTLVKGRDRCTVQVHPTDAARLALVDGQPARLSSHVGAVEAPVEITIAVMPGVVSLPHGWGHGRPGTNLRVAAGRPGTNVNDLIDETVMDPLSGNAVLNGIPVTVTPAAVTAS